MNSKRVDWSKWEVKDFPPLAERGKCRTCNHGEYWHFNNSSACNYDYSHEAKAVSRYTVEILVPIKNKVSMCFCLEYVPGDNLAYLEWCHDRRKV